MYSASLPAVSRRRGIRRCLWLDSDDSLFETHRISPGQHTRPIIFTTVGGVCKILQIPYVSSLRPHAHRWRIVAFNSCLWTPTVRLLVCVSGTLPIPMETSFRYDQVRLIELFLCFHFFKKGFQLLNLNAIHIRTCTRESIASVPPLV